MNDQKQANQINKKIDTAVEDLKYVKITDECLSFVDSLDLNIEDLGNIITQLINVHGEIYALRHQINLDNLK